MLDVDMSVRPRWAAVLVLGALALVSACSDDSERPTSDGTIPAVRSEPTDGSAEGSTERPTGTPAPLPEAGVEPQRFTTVTARVTEIDGEVCEVCVWLADTPEERGRGLMGVTTLGDAAGMVFRFEEPINGTFYMFQTPTPLSIAWFGRDGDLVGSADMAPCLDVPAGECPLYSPGAEYDLALEVFEGGLEPLGIGPGARLELLDGTESDRCPLAARTTP